MTTLARYHAAAHAVQSGIAMLMQIRPTIVEPKHLRVGIDLTKAEQAGLVRLLIAKGVFTEAEYVDAITDGVEVEKARLEVELTEHYGGKTKVTLA